MFSSAEAQEKGKYQKEKKMLSYPINPCNLVCTAHQATTHGVQKLPTKTLLKVQH